MKRVILTIAAIALLAAPASAQILSLWADDGANSCRVDRDGPYQLFEVYVFLEPGIDGAFGAEFKLIAPETHFGAVNEGDSPLVSVQDGAWYGNPGCSLGFVSCQTEMFWMYKLSMRSEDTEPAYYQFGIRDGTAEPYMTVAICPDPRPLIEAFAYNHLGFNTDCVIGTEESSWGAIKSMMD